MSWLEVVVLGLVQGLTEFLPISSSAHLRIVSGVFFGNDPGAAFTAVSQLGTEAAVLIYFARDIAQLVAGWVRGLMHREERAEPEYRLAWLVIIGTVPISVLGLLFKDQIETVARNLWLIATTMVAFGVLLGIAERVGRQKVDLERVTVRQGVGMGLAQALALIPGVSRSGGTITAGLFLGLTRPAAVRLSFLLAIPAVVASGLFELPAVLTPGGPSGLQMAVATVIAFVVGYAAIAWLLRYIEHHSVYLFVWYRIALGAVLFAALGAGWISAVLSVPSAVRPHVGSLFVTTLILLRHGRSSANAAGVLAGRTPGVELDETGRAQAARVVDRLAGVPLSAVVSSPALRCEQTVAPLLADRGLTAVTEPGLAEVDYGSWTGRELKKLTEEPLWRVVQVHPSAAVFPDGEGLAGMQARAVAAVRHHDARIAAEHGPRAVWLVCSHGDVIKSILADALASHLDNFQRIVVDPCSISVVHYTETRPFVVRVNDLGGDVAGLVPPAPKPGEDGEGTSDAVVGGSVGQPEEAPAGR